MEATGYPSLAQIAGHALSNIFLDALAVDVERMRRINHTLSLPHSSRLRRERGDERPRDGEPWLWAINS